MGVGTRRGEVKGESQAQPGSEDTSGDGYPLPLAPTELRLTKRFIHAG